MIAPYSGGPAFPSVSTKLERVTDPGTNTEHFMPDVRSSGGMSLRDYFAGQALAGFLANPEAARAVVKAASSSDDANGRFARTAYDLADAMLAERSKPEASA